MPYQSRSKTYQTSAKVCARIRIGIFRNGSTRSTALDSKLMFWCVSYHLGAFVTVWLSYKLSAKWAELVQNFMPRSRIRIFRNKRTRSTPLDPKLMFWCLSYRLGAFGTVWLPYETRCKTGRTSANVRGTKSCRNVLQRTHPIHPIGP